MMGTLGPLLPFCSRLLGLGSHASVAGVLEGDRKLFEVVGDKVGFWGWPQGREGWGPLGWDYKQSGRSVDRFLDCFQSSLVTQMAWNQDQEA